MTEQMTPEEAIKYIDEWIESESPMYSGTEDALNVLRCAFEAAIAAATEWQPIETAPDASKSTGEIWLFGGRYDKPTLASPDGSFWRYELTISPETVPKFWCPQVIPTPPTEERE